MQKRISALHTGYKLVMIIVLLWTLLISLSFYSDTRNFEEHSIRLATNQANDYWNKDSAFRAWASRHGGLYVKIDARTPPNPLLAHIPHRDVETKEGVKLTLMNPSYIMRQISEEFEELYGVKSRITGQVLLDPQGKRNKPDVWELKSLKRFDQGETEIIQITQINDEPYLRMIRPMIMQQGCLLCHSHLGFNVGDIRGGFSVSVPLKPYEEANNSSRNQAIISHLTIWLIGLFVIFYISIINKRQAENDRQAKELINRSHKMNSLGKLTGGIAHDYNNMLGVVLGYAELLENSLSEQPKLAKYAQQIHHAGERGAKLTKKLLDFSRTKASEAESINLNSLLQNEQHMLEKTLTPRITLVLNLQENLWPVWLDTDAMVDATLNMSINAMHAIKGEGKITIQSSNQRLNRLDARALGLTEGDYVLFSITDTGCGMDNAIKENIFEPFYSTKGDKGTGLGLSQVYGFVQRSGGAIKVYSEVNHGTRLTLFFPRYCDNGGDEPSEENNFDGAFTRNKSILVVDDEPELLDLTCEILASNGLKIFSAVDAKQALNILDRETIDLLLTDIVMPGMNGYQLAEIVKEKYPGVKIQLASGFADDRDMDKVDKVLRENMLSKPLNTHALLQRIYDLLNEK